ncbi:MAG: hypothetical protein HOO06_15450 [Bdellovibrionaceae bacterium]|jgi:hypothetical protein|nr:hypothetical protein [Pseudobdellovibrionaceae bacterium]
MNNLIKYIILSTIFSFSILVFASYIPEKIEGEVVSIHYGEMNSSLGGYCVIIIKEYSTHRRYGIVSNEGPESAVCDDVGTVEIGWPVGVYKEGLSLIGNSALILMFRTMFDQDAYFINYSKNLTLLDNVVSEDEDNSEFIYAVIDYEGSYEFLINTMDEWELNQRLTDNYSIEERNYLRPILTEAGLCELAESSYSLCIQQDGALEKAKEVLASYGIGNLAEFQNWAEQF